MTLHQATLRGIWLKRSCQHTHGYACCAIDATWPVSHTLAPPESDLAQRIIEFARLQTRQFSENLTLLPPREIRARRGAGHVKTGKTELGCHWPKILATQLIL
jgi:hypothetical protein